MRGVLVRSMAAGVAALVLCCSSGLAVAATAGASFTNKDWSLACDNTGTCRASGYQSDSDDTAVSVLLARAAGAGAQVEAKVTFGDFGPQPQGRARLTIGGRALGPLADGPTLTAGQLAALLRALSGDGEIVFASGKTRWRLSREGAAATLLKMDDVQGRIGTPGALTRKGGRPESAVPGPTRPPVVQAVRVARSTEADLPLARRVLATMAPNDDCTELATAQAQQGGPTEGVELWRLGEGRVLVSALCWRGPDNAGNDYGVAHDQPPYDAKAVTLLAQEFNPDEGELNYGMKDRGIGDCWSSATWVWNGHDFVQTAESATGQCKQIAVGGAWQLPTLVSEVRKPR